VRIRQYAYLAIRSPALTGEEIGRRLGLGADRTTVRASRSTDPPRPAHHSWEIVCDERGLTLDEQMGRIVGRVAAHAPAIRALTSAGATATLHAVRDFAAEDGEDERIDVTDEGFERLSGQHQLLGWHLDRDVLAWLVEAGAELDVDEYG
jgi:hypothetical protein